MNDSKAEDTLMKPARDLQEIHLRIALYILTLVLHSVNGLLTVFWVWRIEDKEPDLLFYSSVFLRLFSVWAIIMHIVNAVLGIVCYQNILNYGKKLEKFVIKLKRLKEIFFCAIVWPSTWVCFTYFWFFYHYNKNLLKFDLLMKIGFPINNHIEHTYIIFAALCEVFLETDNEPKSHKRNITYGLSVVAIYVLVLSYTYATCGSWIYPFYDVSYGTIYFPLIILMSCLITVISYYAQWQITNISKKGLKTTKGLLFYLNVQKKLHKNL